MKFNIPIYCSSKQFYILSYQIFLVLKSLDIVNKITTRVVIINNHCRGYDYFTRCRVTISRFRFYVIR